MKLKIKIEYLLFPLGQDGLNVVIGDSGILCAEHLICSMSNHAQHLFVANLLVTVHQPSLLDNDLIQVQFHLGPLHYSLFDCVLCNQTVDPYDLRLPNTMGTILYYMKAKKKKKKKRENLKSFFPLFSQTCLSL